MTEEFINGMTKQEFLNDRLNKSLFEILSEPNGKPIYISEDAEIKNNVNNSGGEGRAYDLDIIERALTCPLSRFDNPIAGEGTPVILLIKKDSAKVNKVSNILKKAGVTVFKQDANRPYSVIDRNGIEETRAALNEQYRDNFSIFGKISEFDNIVDSNANTPPIETGFERLDEVLDGGLYEGLYTIGAISSLGKTAFCLQIADNIASNGHDVLIISMEMSKYEFIGRSISRLTFFRTQESQINYKFAKTERGITDGSRYHDKKDKDGNIIKKGYEDAEIDYISECKELYKNIIGTHLYIYESIGGATVETIERTIKRHIEATGNKPIVIIDYLQCLQHPDKYINANDKMKTDANLWALKTLSRDNKLTIIAISSFNRDSYTKKPSFSSFKESGAIEYTCSVVISMYYKGQGGAIEEAEAKAKNPREIVIEILKNRQGRTGDTINYFYFPMFNYFLEEGNGTKPNRTPANSLFEKVKDNLTGNEKPNDSETLPFEI